jgi:mono/diheme cytochrome c family protein
MPAFTTRQLSDDQVTLIAEHLGGLCSGLAEDIYASNCATCHGASGQGGRSADAVAGPNIRCKDSGDFDEVLRRGKEEMPAFPSLTGVTATRLAHYLHGFCPSGGGGED